MSSAEPVAGPAARTAATLLRAGEPAAHTAGAAAAHGPFTGQHHVTHVLRPEALGGAEWWKVREPRAGVLWFDRRCFSSEEDLLRALARLGLDLPVPEVRAAGDCLLQRFIEGSTLGSAYAADERVPDVYVDQLVPLFGRLARVRPGQLDVARRCDPADRAADADTTYFLDRLVHFVEHRVRRAHRAAYGSLFAALGVPDGALDGFGARLGPLVPRPFCLLHGDLHRENLIVDGDGRLWVIDWELAMLGDPLYDLATHLYLTRYPPEQQQYVTERWRAEVEQVLPGASRGYEADLPRLLAFKRVQSLYTDVIRTAMTLAEPGAESGAEPGFEVDAAAVGRGAEKLRRVLLAAAEPLGLARVPGPGETERALRSWLAGPGQAYVPRPDLSWPKPSSAASTASG
ncbi:phosphotransferase [Streptomyces sp. Da 82-17]|uniref:phosphotransferase n=1 Tax=Streptomyces sp. Da 82-17 TaxID=3377116 RepID=UPI0038D453C6